MAHALHQCDFVTGQRCVVARPPVRHLDRLRGQSGIKEHVCKRDEVRVLQDLACRQVRGETAGLSAPIEY